MTIFLKSTAMTVFAAFIVASPAIAQPKQAIIVPVVVSLAHPPAPSRPMVVLPVKLGDPSISAKQSAHKPILAPTPVLLMASYHK
jgi:hypothetical protein